MPRKDFKQLVETKYGHVGGWKKLEELVAMPGSSEQRIIAILQAFNITYRQATRWINKYREYVEVS